MKHRNYSILAASVAFLLSAVTLVHAQIVVAPLERTLSAGPIRGYSAIVDLSDPRVSPVVTQPFDRSATTRPVAPAVDSLLIPTDKWAKDNNLTLAINAGFFAWIKGDDTHQGGADVVGMSISDGKVVSTPREWNGNPDPALVFLNDGSAHIIGPGQPPIPLDQIRHGVAGVGGGEKDATPGTLLVQDGKNLGNTARVSWNVRHPRTAVGLDATGKRLIILVIDGRQKDWSIGLTLPELADLMIELGATTAINLDGGGSSAFIYTPQTGEPPVTNRPSDKSTPEFRGIFRAVANHLGFRVSPPVEPPAPQPSNRGEHGTR